MTVLAVDHRLGALIAAFVNRVSHGQGTTLAIMSEASVTLPQVLLLRRLQAAQYDGVTELAEAMQMSLPAMSQMLDRLARLGYVTRGEDANDRRRKLLTVTPTGKALMKRLERGRAAEYESGVSHLSSKTRSLLAAALQSALAELEN